MGDTFSDAITRWMIPNDRQLALRGKLDTGWSSYANDTLGSKNVTDNMSEKEQEWIISILQRNESIQMQEQKRINMLIKRLEHMRENILGDGFSTCLICETKAGCLTDKLHFCTNCQKMFCTKCTIEVQPQYDKTGKYNLCVLCNEEKMLWRRSGAWFYNTAPAYMPTEGNEKKLSDSKPRENQNLSHSSSSSPDSAAMMSYVDIQRSRESTEGDDDSDIETTSAIPEHKMSMTHEFIITDDDTFSFKSRSPTISGKRDSTGSIASHSDSDTSIESDQSESDQNFCLLTERHIYVTNRSRVNSAEDTGPKLDGDSVEATEDTIIKKSHEGDDISQEKSETSTLSEEQDIDDLFQSYENEAQEAQEWHGKFGMIQFTVQYDTNTEELLVIVASCKGLKLTGKNSVLNPYVKAILLPISLQAAKASKKVTPVVKKSSDPIFNHTIAYPGICEKDIESKGLKLSVVNESNFGSDQIIGEICIPLRGLTTRPVQQYRRILESRANDEALFLDTQRGESNPGRIELALHYLSKQEKLVVGIIRCVGLKALDPNGYSDPFVKCYLLPDLDRSTKRKTAVRKKTLNPEFHQDFEYEISHAELAKKTLLISVWDHDSGKSNEFIGSLSFGVKSSGDLLKHWFDTLKTADNRVIRWHTLNEKYPQVD